MCRSLVDGKPSGMFKGVGFGQVLLSIPADQYERVEVMTNPSAAYSPEGSGGIINLITKKTRKAGASGSIRANQGTRGRWSASANAAYKGDKLSAQFCRRLSLRSAARHHRPATDRPRLAPAASRPRRRTRPPSKADRCRSGICAAASTTPSTPRPSSASKATTPTSSWMSTTFRPSTVSTRRERSIRPLRARGGTTPTARPRAAARRSAIRSPATITT